MAAWIVFILTYVVLAIGRLPGFRVDRTGAAVIGASLMIAFNVLTLQEAYRAINLDTIVLLFGMMIVVGYLRLSGFFRLVSSAAVRHARSPIQLLVAIVAVAGFFSAFFVNDTMCLILTPLVLDVTTKLRRNPIPYLLAVAMAANIGSAATLTGNPQNMLVGTFSGIPYRQFAACLTPPALFGLILTVAILHLFYRQEFRGTLSAAIEEEPNHIHQPLMWKTLAAAAVMIALFFWGWPVPKVALVTGALLLITRRIKPARIYASIDFSLLTMFASLFVVIAGIEHTPFTEGLANRAATFGFGNVFVLSGVSAIVSNLVSNVPAVLLFKPLLAHISGAQRAWLALAMSSTLAGNLTVLGSVANLIVVEQARRKVEIGFWEYFKAGAPLTVLSLGVGAVWVAWRC